MEEVNDESQVEFDFAMLSTRGAVKAQVVETGKANASGEKESEEEMRLGLTDKQVVEVTLQAMKEIEMEADRLGNMENVHSIAKTGEDDEFDQILENASTQVS